MTTPEEPTDPPWWNADDDSFAGATPLFDSVGEQAQSEGSDADASPSAADSAPPDSAGQESARRTSSNPWSQSDSGPGTPITEALRLAAAASAWSNESGLTDTLRSLAAEAVTLAAAMSRPTAEPAPAASPEDTEATEALAADAAEAGAGTPWYAHQSVCDYCPLCRGMAAMRAVQPQMSAGLAESMASLTTALNSALESLAAPNKPD